MRVGRHEELWQHTIPNMLLTWSGYRMVDCSPQFVGHPEPEIAVPIPVKLRWGVVHRAEDGSVHLKKNIEQLPTV